MSIPWSDPIIRSVVPLLIGFMLDSLLGDPRWLPHPIRLFGLAITNCTGILNKGTHRRAKGMLMGISLIATTYLILLLIFRLCEEYNALYISISSLCIFYALANRSLITEVHAVMVFLRRNDLPGARSRLSWIVGRETNQLNEQQIRKALLETLSENLSDGVVAPLFFYLLGGVPAMLAYKMANTLDSMVGYKNQEFKEFGWFSARFDDLLNLIPSRLTAFLMVIAAASPRGARFAFQYGRRHASPNSGYPEAALAGILNCQFGGPNRYHGVVVDKPFIGEKDRLLLNKDIYSAYLINVASTLIMIALSVFCLIFFS